MIPNIPHKDFCNVKFYGIKINQKKKQLRGGYKRR